MAQSGVSNTALGAATCRLIEQYQPADTRLFNDPFVSSLVGTSIQLVVKIPAMRKFIIQQTDQMAPGIFGAQICPHATSMTLWGTHSQKASNRW